MIIEVQNLEVVVVNDQEDMIAFDVLVEDKEDFHVECQLRGSGVVDYYIYKQIDNSLREIFSYRGKMV